MVRYKILSPGSPPAWDLPLRPAGLGRLQGIRFAFFPTPRCLISGQRRGVRWWSASGMRRA